MRGGDRLLLGLAISVLAACGQPAAEGSADLDVAAIRQAHVDLDDAARRGDYAGWSGLLTTDAVVMPPGLPAIEMERGLRQLFDARPRSLEGGSELLEVEVRGDLAIVRGRYRLRGVGVAGPVEDTGKMLEIWRKREDGRWLLARDIWNSDLPAVR
ncbi:MAG TPA: DUF4440 domain-containing protein [Gemmatimonadota bacterium]|nr:DUF4440 domain-containing protein [Gemmatimonadota bacterium]